MKRASTILAAAVGLALSAVFSAGTASASASTLTSASASASTSVEADPGNPGNPPEHGRGWHRYRDFPNFLLCESSGATGVVLGRWDDWWCDDEDVLWVRR